MLEQLNIVTTSSVRNYFDAPTLQAIKTNISTVGFISFIIDDIHEVVRYSNTKTKSLMLKIFKIRFIDEILKYL